MVAPPTTTSTFFEGGHLQGSFWQWREAPLARKRLMQDSELCSTARLHSAFTSRRLCSFASPADSPSVRTSDCLDLIRERSALKRVLSRDAMLLEGSGATCFLRRPARLLRGAQRPSLSLMRPDLPPARQFEVGKALASTVAPAFRDTSENMRDGCLQISTPNI